MRVSFHFFFILQLITPSIVCCVCGCVCASFWLRAYSFHRLISVHTMKSSFNSIQTDGMHLLELDAILHHIQLASQAPPSLCIYPFIDYYYYWMNISILAECVRSASSIIMNLKVLYRFSLMPSSAKKKYVFTCKWLLTLMRQYALAFLPLPNRASVCGW